MPVSPPAVPARGSHRHPRGGRARRRSRLVIQGLAILAVVSAVLLLAEHYWKDIPALLEQVNKPVAFLLMATLPVIGFPVSAVYLAAGAIFGPALGSAVVAAVTVLHILFNHLLARTFLRRPLERLREKWLQRLPPLPKDEDATLAAMLALVPGPPYFVRNVLLVAAGVSLRWLLLVAVPVYVLRAQVTIFLGDLGADPSRRALLILAGVLVVKLTIAFLLFRRLQLRVRRGA
jgi:uncharacterized membrane protein YdjX (TVP38/TMEM64 family)